uniref:Uncharacterized protein n=1 Tax=Panagrolaimus superbus TaxID=310955 RepID=A0A914YJ71_9BILA
MSTVILTRPNTNTYNHNKLSLHHQWDVSAKPFIPRPCGGSSDESASSSSTTSSPPRVASTSPEYHRPAPSKRVSPSKIITTPKRVASHSKNVINVDPVSSLFNRAATQHVHMGNQSIRDIDDRSIRSQHGSSSSSSTTTATTTTNSSLRSRAITPAVAAAVSALPLYAPQSVSLCEKPIKKTALMATTEYFMQRWNKKNEIESVTHAILNGTYLESIKNPTTSNVPSLFDDASPFPPVLINALPSLMNFWCTS